jgi:hypothetical protein
MNDRVKVFEAALAVSRGQGSFLTQDARDEPGRCAQLVREVTEFGLAIQSNSWGVGNRARSRALHLGRSTRYATDYEWAANDLNLDKGKFKPGDIGYNKYIARNGENYGHTWIFLGPNSDGVQMVLENTDHPTRGIKPLGRGPVRVTPLSQVILRSPITLIAAVTFGAMDEAEPIASAKPQVWLDGEEVASRFDQDGLIVNSEVEKKVFVAYAGVAGDDLPKPKRADGVRVFINQVDVTGNRVRMPGLIVNATDPVHTYIARR